MRVLGGVALAAALASCSGQGTEPPGELTCRGCDVEFGKVAVGDEVTRQITLVNPSNEPVWVEENHADLGSFTTELVCHTTCQRHEIAPGEQLAVAFTFRPTSEGAAEQTVTFGTYSSADGPVDVHLKGVAVVPTVSCAEHLDFGALVQGTSLTGNITCKNQSPFRAVVVVEPAGDDTGQFSVKDGPLKIAPLGSIDIPVTVSANLLPDNVTTSVSVCATIRIDDGAGATLGTTLACVTVLRSALEMDPGPSIDKMGNPQPYDFGFVAPGRCASKTFTLRNLGSKPLTITTLAIDGGSDPEFAVSSPEPPPFQIPGGGSVEIELTFCPSTGDVGARTGQLNLNSDDPAGQVRFYDIAGFGGGPDIFCTWDGAPGPLDFGVTTVGTTRTRTIACTNTALLDDPTTSADNLKVLAPSLEHDHGVYQPSIEGGPLRNGWGMGQGFTVDVQYTPRSGSTQDDDVVVLKTNVTDHPEIDIPIAGKGGL